MGNWSRTKVLRLAKGFQGRAKNCYSLAIVRLHKSLQQAYRGRKLRRRNARREWITRINSALAEQSVRYSQFVYGLNVYSNVVLNRKILAELAVNEPYSFRAVVNEVVEQAGVPRVPLPPMSYEEAKAQGDIVGEIPKEEPKEVEFQPLRIRPGVTLTDADDYLRLTHVEEDAKWRAKRLSKVLTKKQLKKLVLRKKKGDAKEVEEKGDKKDGGKAADKGGKAKHRDSEGASKGKK